MTANPLNHAVVVHGFHTAEMAAVFADWLGRTDPKSAGLTVELAHEVLDYDDPSGGLGPLFTTAKGDQP